MSKRLRDDEASPTPALQPFAATSYSSSLCPSAASDAKPTATTTTTDTVAPPPSVPDNIVWSSFIKAHHQRIRDSIKTEHGGDAGAAWRALLANQDALEQYASSMHHLATKYWDTPPPLPSLQMVVATRSLDGVGDGAANMAKVTSEDATCDDSADDRRGSGAVASDNSKYRYDDRIEYALHCVQEYFFGPVAGSGVGSDGGVLVPLVASIELKQAKRTYYQAHERPMPESEQVEWVRSWLMSTLTKSRQEGSATNCCALSATFEIFSQLYNLPSVSVAEDTQTATSSSSSPSVLRFLDVGSCYAPFEGKRITTWAARTPLVRHDDGDDGQSPVAASCWLTASPGSQAVRATCNAVTLDVVSIDLAPYKASTVWPCDWLGVQLDVHPHRGDSKATGGVHSARSASALAQLRFEDSSDHHVVTGTDMSPPPSYCGRPRVCGIAVNSFDVVTFSLVLSYMPTPRMRFEACRKAHAVLRDYGLLVVISTRTQGPRQASWVNEWITAIESIGFVRVHKNIRCRLIGLTFQKKPPSVLTSSSAPSALSSEVVEVAASSLSPDENDAMASKMVVTADTI
jgi:25S rRNA (adenine2142-N1)-methyltransferase